MFLFRIIVHSPRDFKLSYSWRLVRFQSSLVMTYLLLELMLLTFRYLDWSTSLGFSPFTLTCACWNYVWEILLFLMFESLYLGLGWRKISFLFLDVWESFTRWSWSEKKKILMFVFKRERLFFFLLDVWWSCLDDLDLKRKVGLPPFFFWKVFVFFFFLERLIVWRRCLSFALIFWGSSVLMISIGKERFFFFFGVMFQSEVRTFSLSWFLRIFLDDLDH
jgi:hypothetical protein